MTPRRTDNNASNTGGTPKAQPQRVNEMIRAPQVRVISEDSEQLGVMSPAEALRRAREANLDLVEVAPNVKPPVCRIMDFGKYKYEQKKRAAKQQAQRPQMKELRLRPATGEHDINVRLNQARAFLARKDKVLVSVVFRGREMQHIAEGEKFLATFLEQLEDIARVEAPPKQMGRRIVCTLVAK